MKVITRFRKLAGLLSLSILCSFVALTGCSNESGSDDVSISSIAVTTAPTKTTYVIGSSLDLTGLVVTGTYSDATVAVVDNDDLTVSGFSSLVAVATQTVTVAVSGKTATFDVVIKSQASTATGVTTSSGYTAYLGGESCQVTLSSMTVDGVEQLSTTPVYIGSSSDDGSYALTWNDYTHFQGVTGLGDAFVLKYTFTDATLTASNWNNWAFALNDGTDTWYLRADTYSNSTLSAYPDVSYSHIYDWDNFATQFTGKKLVLTVTKTASSIVATLTADGTLLYTATAEPAVTTYAAYLGGQSCQLVVSSVKLNGTEQLSSNYTIGTETSGSYVLNTEDYIKAYGIKELSTDEDWTIQYTFKEATLAAQFYHNWEVYLKYNGESVNIRSDNWVTGDNGDNVGLDTYPAITKANSYDWTSIATMCGAYNGKTTVVTVTKTDASIVVSAVVDGASSAVYTVTAAK